MKPENGKKRTRKKQKVQNCHFIFSDLRVERGIAFVEKMLEILIVSLKQKFFSHRIFLHSVC
jgi:hypothetical protein